MDAAIHEPRVVVVTSRLDIGGTERHLARILPPLRERGIDVTLYLMERGGRLEGELARQGVRLMGPSRSGPNFLHWFRAALELTRLLRRECPDVVHFFLPRPYIYGSLAAELAGHRRRLMSRRSLSDYRDRYPFVGGIERMLHRRTAGLIGNSVAVFNQLAEETSQRDKLALIYNGVDISARQDPTTGKRTRHSLGVADEALVITTVANLIPYKGHADLIDALAFIKDALPQPWRLFAIGRDEGIGMQLRQKAEEIGIGGNILWLGEQADIEPALQASDLFVLASHQEGFSNALLEAMVTGIAVIATAAGGNRDAVIHEESGLLVAPRKPTELSAAILRLAKDGVSRNRLANAGRSRAQAHFSLVRCIDQYELLYRAVCEPTLRPLSDVFAHHELDRDLGSVG